MRNGTRQKVYNWHNLNILQLVENILFIGLLASILKLKSYL